LEKEEEIIAENKIASIYKLENIKECPANNLS
jgi:hypothetical protein